MPTTPLGIEYPDSGGHTRLWEHLQTLAESADAAIDGLAESGKIQIGPVLIQWGTANNSAGPGVNVDSPSITFPIAFSTAPRLWINVNAGVIGSGHVGLAQILSLSASAFTFRTRFSDDNSHSGLAVYWLAAGLA